jgi:DNA-binding CsgD family transcriptional regulator
MGKSTAARAEARFKQLCSLGLGAEAVMPALLRELHSLIPACGGSIWLADAKGALANRFFDCNTPAQDRLYFAELYSRTREVGYTFADLMRAHSGVRDTEEISASIGSNLRAWRRSDHYNLLCKPQGIDFALRLVVREHPCRRGVGLLYLYRELRDRWFSTEEKRRLALLESFLAHALTAPTKTDMPVADSGRRGLVVANREGRPLHFSAEGRRLLRMATHPRAAPDTDFSQIDMLPATVTRLCNDLARIFADDPSESAPSYHCRNVWGAFTFHAQSLEGTEPSSGLIGITISHQEPLPIRLMRSIEHLCLSPRRAEACLLMANGASFEAIARRLGISTHTAVAHGRWIYEKLNVHTRTELLSRLLAVPV